MTSSSRTKRQRPNHHDDNNNNHHPNKAKRNKHDLRDNPNKKEKRRDTIGKEISQLRERLLAESPERGYAPPLQQRVAFRALPLSEATLKGLEECKTPFTTMTAIQNACIPHALAGRDILGAARTGSGKTLAFLIPTLEILYRNHFGTHGDTSPGAIILSPTRELAVQTFEVLRQIGKYHSFSVGLLIGGAKDFYEEQQRVPTTNILIATPGRLLQHLEQTPMLEMSEVQIFVLDEADRILDMGFRDQLVRILDYLPTVIDNRDELQKGKLQYSSSSSSSATKRRQTLLFSATQTKSISQLATLSMNQPEYLGVHDKEQKATPEGLQQSYVVVDLEHKFNAVYSFIKSHLSCKSIVFLASCSQVRYAWELFCSLRPGISVLALHGKLSQEKRTKIYFDFIHKKSNTVRNQKFGGGGGGGAAILFATDIAARGLDFPNVDWVVQMDAPEDRDMYIHRVGRTARYRSGGKSLLMITPQEEKNGLIRNLLQEDGKRKQSEDTEDKEGKNTTKKSSTIPLKKLSINPTKTVLVSQKAASMVASNQTLHTLAKKAFHSYMRSISLMPNQTIFKALEYPLDAYAKSLGLASTPTLRFLKSSMYNKVAAEDDTNNNDASSNRDSYRKTKNVNRKLQKLKEQIKAEKLAKKLERLGKKPKDSSDDEEDDDEDDDDLLVYKGSYQDSSSRKANDGQEEKEELSHDVDVHKVSTSRQKRKIRIDGSNTTENKHIIFDDDDDDDDSENDGNENDDKELSLKDANQEYLAQVRERLQKNMEQDRSEEQNRVRQKHRKNRLQERGQKEDDIENDDNNNVVLLQQFDDNHSSSSSNNNNSDSDSSSSSEEDDNNSQSSSSSSSSSEESGITDLKAQEDLALSLIGN